MDRRDIENMIECINSYLNTWEGKNEIKSIYNSIKGAIKSTTLVVEGKDQFKQKYKNLISELEKEDSIEPILIALKNKQDLFDLYIFPKAISVNFDEIISSEQFFAKIRKEKISEGKVIPDIPFESLFNFLKAYYIYRGKVELSKTSNNPAYNYSNKCLEMKSVTDLFNDINHKSSVMISNVLIYSDEALPYSLDYLDDYITTLSNGTNKKSFEQILKDAKEDKYLGTTLSKFYNVL